MRFRRLLDQALGDPWKGDALSVIFIMLSVAFSAVFGALVPALLFLGCILEESGLRHVRPYFSLEYIGACHSLFFATLILASIVTLVVTLLRRRMVVVSIFVSTTIFFLTVMQKYNHGH